MPLTTPANRRRLFLNSASSLAVVAALCERRSSPSVGGRRPPLQIGPNLSEFTAQTGRAPIAKLSSANTLEVSRLVRQTMAELQPDLPAGMQMDVVNDAAIYTQQSFNTIRKTLAEAVLFTGLILLLFLHTWRSTLIVLIAIPTSLMATFGLMNLLGL